MEPCFVSGRYVAIGTLLDDEIDLVDLDLGQLPAGLYAWEIEHSGAEKIVVRPQSGRTGVRIPDPRMICQHKRPARAQWKNSMGAHKADVRITKIAARFGTREALAIVYGDRVVGENEFRLGLCGVDESPDRFRPDGAIQVLELLHCQEDSVTVMHAGHSG